MTHAKKLLSGTVLFLLSFLLLLLWNGFHPESFLIDDNRTQWFPVIEEAYGTFFRTGTMPVYDFFQFKGFSIADPGYYGIMNPVMLLAYMLSHFTPLPFTTITLYTALLFSLGNVFFFRLCREFRCSLPCSLLLTAAYCGMSAFTAFCYWYYVYNNYLMIPLLILVFLRTRGKAAAWFACGVLLAFDILLGNVQYTCYHYILFGLISVVYMLLDHKNRMHIMLFLSNILCALLLSAPFLLMAMNAGGNFQTTGTSEFHMGRESLAEILVGAFIPMGIRGLFGNPTLSLWSLAHDRVDFTWLYNGGFAAVWLVLAVYGIRLLWSRRSVLKSDEMQKEIKLSAAFQLFRTRLTAFYRAKIVQEDGSHLIIIGMIFCVLFFVSLLRDSTVAQIMAQLPVLKQFRFLFKCQFIIQPLVGILTASVLPRLQSGKLYKAAVSGLCLFACVGLVNNAFVVQTAHQLFAETERLSLAEENAYYESEILPDLPDLDTYRYITVLPLSIITPDTFRYYNGLLRNYPTTAHVYSLTGYEMSAPVSHTEQYRKLFGLSYTSARMIGNSLPKDLELVSKSDAAKQQFLDSSIKYILVETDPGNRFYALYERKGWESCRPSAAQLASEQQQLAIDNTALLLSTFEEAGFAVADVRPLDSHYTLIELADPKGLCTDSSGQALPLSAERMDQIVFDANGSERYTLSFSYEERLTACRLDASGQKVPLTLTADENGNTIVHAQPGDEGTICISYHNPLYTAAFLFEALISLLFVCTLFLVESAHARNSRKEDC